MDSSKKIKQNQIEDYISNSTQIELNNKVNSSEISNLIREEFLFIASQTFTLSNNYGQVYSVEVSGQGALKESQYTLVPDNQVTINDTLDVGDYVVILYSNAVAGLQPYYSQAEVDNLLSNKANSVLNYVEKSNNYTALITDDIINFTNGTYILNLFTAVGNIGKKLTITNTGVGTITLDTLGFIYSGETIDIVSNNINWIMI